MQIAANQPYMLSKDAGVMDVWFPLWEGHYIAKAGAEQTEGRLLLLLIHEPLGGGPPLHIHHNADEAWYVIDGHLTLLIDGKRIEAGPGDFAFGPKGLPHAYIVTSEQAEFLVTFTPAGTEGPSGYGVEGFFRDIGFPVVPGEPHPGPVPVNPEEFARKAKAYGIEIVGPPLTL
jgi:quercetin dioxygenase-like cupin family protein